MPYDLMITQPEIKHLIDDVIKKCNPENAAPKYMNNKIIGYWKREPKYQLQARLCVYRDLTLIDEREFKYYWDLLNYEYEKNFKIQKGKEK